MSALIVIPARLKATRLPDKPLAMIGDAPMIVQVWRRAVAANAGPVIVAAGDQAIADAITAAGGTAVMTDPDLPSGSDRVHAAAESYDRAGKFDVVVNVQGDLPTLEPKLVAASLTPLANPAIDIATVVARIVVPEELTDAAVVKAAVSFPPTNGSSEGTVGPALYFSRNLIPSGDGDHYHHIGIYAFRRAALRRFVTLKPTVLELRERLEQLRAIEDGMRMAAALVDTIPLGVDTPADLERARRLFRPL
ncbi:MAG: 3-deoxy-manno-octulosonate cytidylyltransferase [Rhodospirillaceae bacterium]|nr:MAG: 3-deoxy-manno-octulosonate cytidylyltransferase [Rhodospirillaceae bacterium]